VCKRRRPQHYWPPAAFAGITRRAVVLPFCKFPRFLVQDARNADETATSNIEAKKYLGVLDTRAGEELSGAK
jgi:hypothetical protein